ncbi:hypothetical protein D3C79_1081120 [compost metagenome]
MFGDRVVTRAVDNMVAETRRVTEYGGQSYTKRGGIMVPAVASVAMPANASSVRASPHTYYGDRFK